MPVIDEIGLEGVYDFNVKWEEGNFASLEEALAELGLKLIMENCKMKMVVIRPASESEG